MPTLRRSKSLNDKLTKNKNRSGDVIRDPRTPEVEGRTRHRIDNFQALVHLRKQTEDKARQLELAISYATSGNTYIRRDLPGSGRTQNPRVPPGGVELPYCRKPATATTGGGGGNVGVRNSRQTEAADSSSATTSRIPGPGSAAHRRQRSAEREPKGFVGLGVKRQESYSDGPPPPLRPITQLRVRDSQRSQRPMSMIEQRIAEGSAGPMTGGGPIAQAAAAAANSGAPTPAGVQLFHPVLEELTRKDHIIQNLTDSQKTLNAHNQQLLGKVDELEFLNHRLRDILDAHGVAYNEASFLKLQDEEKPPGLARASRCGGDGDGNGAAARSRRERVALPAFNPVSSFKPGFVNSPVSPNSEASVSGYGSLASGSACGDNFMTDPSLLSLATGGIVGVGVCSRSARTAGVGDYDDDDPLALSDEISRAGSLDSNCGKRGSPAQCSSLAGEEARGATVNRDSDKSDIESIHEKLDQVLELGKSRESDTRRRIRELEKDLTSVTAQRDAVLERFKLLVEENQQQTRRDGRIEEEVGRLLDEHGGNLQPTVVGLLRDVQEQLRDSGQEVSHQIAAALHVLAASPASSSSSSSPSPPVGMSTSQSNSQEPQIEVLIDKVVDLIGADYMRLGRHLGLSQLEVEQIDKASDRLVVKIRMVLHNWLQRRGREERTVGEEEGGGRVPAAKALAQALRTIDKDIRLVAHTPISAPERQALRNCLQHAVDHVTDPSLILDHLITVKELTPAGISFIREVTDRPDRALARLWHVAEFRGTGIISRLALALERANYRHVSCKLTDELELQNSRLHSNQADPLREEPEFIDNAAPSGASALSLPTPPPPPPPPRVAAASIGSHPPASQARSRPVTSMLPRPRSRTAFDRVPLPVRKSSLQPSSSAASKTSSSSTSTSSSSSSSSSSSASKGPTTTATTPRETAAAGGCVASLGREALERPARPEKNVKLEQKEAWWKERQQQQSIWDRRLSAPAPGAVGGSPRGGSSVAPGKTSLLLERGSHISRV